MKYKIAINNDIKEIYECGEYYKPIQHCLEYFMTRQFKKLQATSRILNNTTGEITLQLPFNEVIIYKITTGLI